MTSDRGGRLLPGARLIVRFGLELLELAAHRPAVVFTTAFGEYAVDAFGVEAADYLMKPFGRTRFAAAVDRVVRRLAAERAAASAGGGEEPLLRLFARRGEVMVPIDLADVVRIEGADDYAHVHVSGGTHLVSMTLAELTQRLEPSRFLRIHRQHIVNLDHIRSLKPHDERRLVVLMSDGHQVIASRTGSRLLRTMVR